MLQQVALSTEPNRTTALGTALLWTAAILSDPEHQTESRQRLNDLTVDADRWDYTEVAQRLRSCTFTPVMDASSAQPDPPIAFYPYLVRLPQRPTPIIHPDGIITFPPSYWLRLERDQTGLWSIAGLTREARTTPIADYLPAFDPTTCQLDEPDDPAVD
ncbi:hypothetical protein GCM10011575_31160 [Microlunatus endophyticus]|uniref:Uncharacterized protein n=1 Tax=Microlunatus endophyticus TaxID=1716077 RepID=A0A917W6N9_9ACTN|nr:hypothetical protein GCM10011575_31160 [Microlunatus endophyticus]